MQTPAGEGEYRKGGACWEHLGNRNPVRLAGRECGARGWGMKRGVGVGEGAFVWAQADAEGLAPHLRSPQCNSAVKPGPQLQAGRVDYCQGV